MKLHELHANEENYSEENPPFFVREQNLAFGNIVKHAETNIDWKFYYDGVLWW